MNRKIKMLVIFSLPLLALVCVLVWRLVSFAMTIDEQWGAPAASRLEPAGSSRSDQTEAREREESEEHIIAPIESDQMENALAYYEVDFSIYSQQALLINLTTGEVMFAHDADVRVYPASLTKIMTVLVGLEQATSDTMIVKADFERILLDNASVAGFEYGETRTLMEVLHGAMLPSGADATATIAYNIADSYEGFVALMNEKARELGMDDTNFTNASGLHHDNHYTTAADMAILLRHALDNPRFREIFTARAYSFTTFYGEQRTMYSTLFANTWTTEFSGGEMIGGRTGFTNAAGRCLASLATNGVDDFILITFGADSYAADQTAHIADAFAIYDYFLSRE